MGGAIYLIDKDGKLVEMSEQSYDSEEVLQELLAKYPHLLAGEQMNPSMPRRWLLVCREAGIPAEEDTVSRWSADHLFLDQDGIPTLVEVKRSKDTRIRREVVGQMLDYAANAVMYWPVEAIRNYLEARCEREGLDRDELVLGFLGADIDEERFWQDVRTNLQAGKVRLVFVADQIPLELSGIVQFLNRQMDPAEVLAIEVKMYSGEGLRSLVPRLIGTPKQQVAPNVPRKEWNEGTFLTDLESRRGTDEKRIAVALLDWAKNRNLRVAWGKGKVDGTFYPMIDHNNEKYWSVSVWTSGWLTFQFGNMKERPVFGHEEKRRELLQRLNQVPGVKLPEDCIARYPSVPLALFSNETVLKQFLDVFDWYIAEIRQNGRGQEA